MNFFIRIAIISTSSLLSLSGCCNQDPIPYTACVDGRITSGTYPACPCNANCSPVYIPGRAYTDLGNGRCEVLCPQDVSCSRDGGADAQADGGLGDTGLTDSNVADSAADVGDSALGDSAVGDSAVDDAAVD